MADSDSGADIAGESDFEDDGGPGFDPSQLTKLTDKQRKKWDKNVRVWRAFMDFLVRHVAIATYKYNCFEAEDLAQFVIAMEKGEAIRSKTKLKKGEEKRVTSFKSMKETSELLAQHQCLVEARRIGNFVDIAGRMRGLGTIAGGFYKSLKKGKVNKLDKIKHYLDYWKGFTVRTFDFSQLAFRNADPRTFNELESKYRVWPTAVRTALHLAQKFLKTASDATGLEVLVRDLRLQQQHMQTAEIVLAARMEDVMRRESGARDSAVTLGSSLLQPRRKQVSYESPLSAEFDQLDVSDIAPELLEPIPDDGILLSLPSEVPKEKKKAKKKKKGSLRPSRTGSHKPRKKRK